MAGIINRTARQFNVRTITKDGQRALIRIAPGFNIVPDEYLSLFVNGDHIDPYLKDLQDNGFIDFGEKIDDMEFSYDPDVKTKYKLEPISKLREEAKTANEEAEKAALENDKLKFELEKAKAEAEKATLELEQIKSSKKSNKKKVEE